MRDCKGKVALLWQLLQAIPGSQLTGKLHRLFICPQTKPQRGSYLPAHACNTWLWALCLFIYFCLGFLSSCDCDLHVRALRAKRESGHAAVSLVHTSKPVSMQGRERCSVQLTSSESGSGVDDCTGVLARGSPISQGTLTPSSLEQQKAAGRDTSLYTGSEGDLPW